MGYDERILVPPWVWVVAAALAASLGWAFGAYLGAGVGWTAGLVAFGLGAVVLTRAGGRVRVDATALSVGRAHLTIDAVGPVAPLDADAARLLRGRGADPRAFLFLKGWVASAVRVDVTDVADPTPYWYVSTRHPDRLADALIQARDANTGSDR